MSTLSVIIPAYRGERFIGDALASIARQSRLPQEVIVVDDASPDDTRKCVLNYASQSSFPLRLLPLEKNSGGPAHPINVGVENASGELIAILDQDDYLLPHHLQTLTSALESHADVALAFGLSSPFGTVESAPKILQPPWLVQRLGTLGEPSGAQRLIDGPVMAAHLMALGNFLVGYPAFMFRRAHWLEKGGTNTQLLIASDYDLECWLCSRGRVAFFPEPIYQRRSHGENLSSSVLLSASETASILLHNLPLCQDLLQVPPLIDYFRNFFFWHLGALVGSLRWFEVCRLLVQARSVLGLDRNSLFTLLTLGAKGTIARLRTPFPRRASSSGRDLSTALRAILLRLKESGFATKGR